MHFSVEQIFLTDSSGRPLGSIPAAAYHVVEAESLDGALASFLRHQQASLVGTIQRLAGPHVVATAQQARTVFSIHVVAGRDQFTPATSSPALVSMAR